MAGLAESLVGQSPVLEVRIGRDFSLASGKDQLEYDEVLLAKFQTCFYLILHVTSQNPVSGDLAVTYWNFFFFPTFFSHSMYSVSID